MSAPRRQKKTRKSASSPRTRRPPQQRPPQSQPFQSSDLARPDETLRPTASPLPASFADSTSTKGGGSRATRRSTPAPSDDRTAAIREADARQARFVAGIAALAFAVGVVFFFAGQKSRRLAPPSKPGATLISTPQKLADAVAVEVEKERSNAIPRRAVLETSVKIAAATDAVADKDVKDAKTDVNAARLADSDAKTAVNAARLADSDAKNADAADATSPSETFAFVVELNAASKAELANLPRVGEKLAERIIERREELGGFRSVDDLLGVKGIGEKTLDKMRPFCVVAPLDDAK